MDKSVSVLGLFILHKTLRMQLDPRLGEKEKLNDDGECSPIDLLLKRLPENGLQVLKSFEKMFQKDVEWPQLAC